jgi:hypothetical protein
VSRLLSVVFGFSWHGVDAAGPAAERSRSARIVRRLYAVISSIYDEEPLGLPYFRTKLEGADNSNLTMPRTFG